MKEKKIEVLAMCVSTLNGIRLDDIIVGLKATIEIYEKLDIQFEYNKVLKYSLSVARYNRFNSIDEYFDEILEKFFLEQKERIFINYTSYKSKEIQDLFANYPVDVRFVNFFFSNFLEILFEEVIYKFFIKQEEKITLLFSIDEIEEIYELEDVNEAIDDFKKDMIILLNYSGITTSYEYFSIIHSGIGAFVKIEISI